MPRHPVPLAVALIAVLAACFLGVAVGVVMTQADAVAHHAGRYTGPWLQFAWGAKP